MSDHRPATRRRLLAAAAALFASGLPGCAAADRTGSRPPAAAPSDTALARRAARDSARLLGAYRAAVQRHPTLRPVLQPLAAHHAEHLAGYAPERPPAVPATRVAAGRAQALDELRRLERSVAWSRRRDTVEAASGDLARILAATVACQAQHLVLLGSALGGQPSEQPATESR